ncbi:MAG TPA: hypothetical protein VF316_17370 [Polyangiaceae bacterium]
MSLYVRGLGILALGALLAGCPKKTEATPDAGKPTAATTAESSASASPTAAASDTAAPSATPAQAAALPPSGAPEVVDDPNAPPSHDDHDKAATAAIQKNNYKAELDKLEKEDLNATK